MLIYSEEVPGKYWKAEQILCMRTRYNNGVGQRHNRRSVKNVDRFLS